MFLVDHDAVEVQRQCRDGKVAMAITIELHGVHMEGPVVLEAIEIGGFATCTFHGEFHGASSASTGAARQYDRKEE